MSAVLSRRNLGIGVSLIGVFLPCGAGPACV